MPEVQSISADALIKLLQPQPPALTQEQALALVASPALDRSKRGGLISAEDLIDVLEAGQPGFLERTIKGFAEFGKSLIDDTIDFGQRSKENAEALSLAVLSTARVAPAREGSQFGTPQFGVGVERTQEEAEKEKASLLEDAINPDVFQAKAFESAVDSASQVLGFGLGGLARRVGGQVATTVGARLVQDKAAGFFSKRAVAAAALRGAGLGLSPVFVGKEDTGLAARAEQAATFAAFSSVLEPIAGVVGAKLVRRRKMKLLAEIDKGLQKLNAGQLLRNTLPRAVERMTVSFDALGALTEDIYTKAGAKMAVVAAERAGLGLKPIGAGLRTIQFNKALKETSQEVLEQFKSVAVEEIQLVNGVVSKLMRKNKKTLKREFQQGFNLETLRSMNQEANRLLFAINTGKFKGDTVNHLTGLVRNIDEFAKQSIVAVQNLNSPSPLQTALKSLTNPRTIRRVSRGEEQMEDAFKATTITVRNSLFSWFSVGWDSLGNAQQIAGNAATRGVADLTDVLLGNAARGNRLGAVVNTIRNRKAAKRFILKNFKASTAAGEEIGEFAALSRGEKVAEALLFGPLELKGLADRQTRRLFARVNIMDEAYKAANQAGAKGLERRLFVDNFIRGGLQGELPGLVQARIIRNANRGAFVIPRGVGFTRFVDSPWTQILISPFARFGRAWLEFTAEYVPIIGAPFSFKRALADGKLPFEAMTDAVTKQLAGAGFLDFLDRIYDDLIPTPFGLKYVDRDTGRERNLPSPMTDGVAILASIRGDGEKFAGALQGSGLTFLGGGLAGGLLTGLSDPGSVPLERIWNDMDRLVGSLFVGKATLRMFNNIFTDFQEEPFTESGFPLPGATTLPFLTGRPRIRAGGGDEPSFLPIKGTDIQVPRSLGSLLTEKELNNMELFADFVRRKTGTKLQLTRFPNVTLRTQRGLEVDAGNLDDTIKRFFVRRRNAYFSDQVVGRDKDPFVRALVPRALEQWVNTRLSYATSMAKVDTEHQFATTLTAVGAIRE